MFTTVAREYIPVEMPKTPISEQEISDIFNDISNNLKLTPDQLKGQVRSGGMDLNLHLAPNGASGVQADNALKFKQFLERDLGLKPHVKIG